MSSRRVILVWLCMDGGAARQTVGTSVLSEACIETNLSYSVMCFPARALHCVSLWGELAAAATPPQRSIRAQDQWGLCR